MYGRSITPAAAAAATLPLTGSPAVGLAMVGAGMLLSGLLLYRTARHRKHGNDTDTDKTQV